MTLDGFIADPDGGYDWIMMDEAIDFASIFREFDTFVMGRKTFEVTAKQPEWMAMFGDSEVIVFSKTLKAAPHPKVRVVNTPPEDTIRELKSKPGKDIWLFGGGELFRSLVDAGLVDTVEVGIMPVLLQPGNPDAPRGRTPDGYETREVRDAAQQRHRHAVVLAVIAARWLSIIAHPFVMVGVMVGVAAAARQPPGEAQRSVAIVVGFTVVPLLVLMVRQVQRGAWENADASNRAERPVLYLAGGVALVALLAYVTVLRPHPFMVRGVVGTLGMLAACAVATRWVKVSLHMAFCALAATVLTLMGSVVGYVLVLLLPALAWARLTLNRHSAARGCCGRDRWRRSGCRDSLSLETEDGRTRVHPPGRPRRRGGVSGCGRAKPQTAPPMGAAARHVERIPRLSRQASGASWRSVLRVGGETAGSGRCDQHR